MSRNYLKVLALIVFILFECSKAQQHQDYVSKRLSLDQIDTVFLSSISASSSDYIVDLRDESSTLPNRIKNAQNLLLYKDYLYVGAENWLLKINKDTFKIEQSIRYGPLYDSPFCRYDPINECSNGHTRKISNNQNKLLLIYADKSLLLSCWTARQGICEMRDLNDLNNLVMNSSIGAVANDPLNSTMGFIALSANSQHVLYMATTFNNNGPYRADIPALSARSLQSNSKFMQVLSSRSHGLKSNMASIEFMPRFMNSFIVKYIDAFNLGIYNFILSVQHSDTDSLLSGERLMSKISRLCLNDLSFTKSYVEMPIECHGVDSLRAVHYNELVSTKHVRIGAHTYLIGLFEHTTRNSFNASIDPSVSKQAVCAFKLSDIQDKFRVNIDKCYNEDGVMRGLSFIKPDQMCLATKTGIRNSNGHIEDDFCSSAENGLYPIGGTVPIQSNALIQFDAKYYESLTIYQSQMSSTLMLKSQKLNTLDMFNVDEDRLNEQNLLSYRSVQVVDIQNNVNIKDKYLPKIKDTAVDQQAHVVYVLQQNQLAEVKMSMCEQYTSCGQCMSRSIRDEPYCGWCSATNKCTTQDICDAKWLSIHNLNTSTVHANRNSIEQAVQSMCVDIEFVQPNKIYLNTIDQWINIKFRYNLNSIVNNNNNNKMDEIKDNNKYTCVFTNENLNDKLLETRAVEINTYELKCPMPHLTLIKKLYDEKLTALYDKKETMVLADDGIFKQTIDNNNSHKFKIEQINLGIHVQNLNLKYGWSSLNAQPIFNITVINCQMHKSCISCVSDDMSGQCSWCNNQCRARQDMSSDNDKCTIGMDQCESFDPATNKLLIPYTAHRQQAPLVFTLNNLLLDNTQNKLIECHITNTDASLLKQPINLEFKQINKTHSSCILNDVFENKNYLYKYLIDQNNNGQVQTNLRLFIKQKDTNINYYIDSPSNGKLSLVFYGCEYKATDCSSCLSINSQLSCMWCSGTCRFMNRHSKLAIISECMGATNYFSNGSSLSSSSSSSLTSSSSIINAQCDRPQITSISPSKVAYSGGSIITIDGINIGSNFDDLISVHLKCKQTQTKCDLIQSKYVSSKRIECKLRQINSQLSINDNLSINNNIIDNNNQCTVNVKLKTSLIIPGANSVQLTNGQMSLLITSNKYVSLVDPIISDIQPSQVIQSANFVWLTINGVELDAGSTRHVEIIDNEQKQRVVKCDIKNVTSSSIRCRLNEKFTTLGKKNLRLIIDKYTSINSILNVNSDPLVKSIDNAICFYAGGCKFNLNGFNFDSVQSAYTFVAYKDVWYSEPVSARLRLTNDRIVFETPALTDAFFSLQNNINKKSANHRLQVGFLMDGFNVTLKNEYINYVPDLNPDQIDVLSQIKIIKIDNLFRIKIKFKFSSEFVYLIRDNLQLYIGCSLCDQVQWSNQNEYECTLPPLLSTTNLNNDQSSFKCEAKVFNALLDQLNEHGRLKMINIFVANIHLKKLTNNLINDNSNNNNNINDNLNLYIKSYQLNNIDNFMNTIDLLQQQQTYEQVNGDLKNLLDKYKQYLLEKTNDMSKSKNKLSLSSMGLMSNKSLFVLSAVIVSIVIVLILITLSLSSYLIKIHRQHYAKSVYKLGRMRRGGRRVQFDQIQKQIDQLEVCVRSKCSQLYQQLHTDYLNELNNDLIYTLNALPVWNYKTYLYSYIFPIRHQKHKIDLIYSNFVMSLSSMSNSTTNTLISTHTPTTINLNSQQQQHHHHHHLQQQQQQQQQQQSQSMSVYATIKSNSMIRFDQHQDNFSLNRQNILSSYGNIGEAMFLFDQLIHNKNFLISFINVCESQRDTFGAKERHNFSSLLTLALKDNIHYLYHSVIKPLLGEHINQILNPSTCPSSTSTSSSSSSCSSKRNPNNLIMFGNGQSLIEPLVNNFISMFMYDYQRDSQTALHLYRLVKSVQSYIEMAPCDQVKQLSVHSLNEDTLLSDTQLLGPYSTIYVNVMLNTNLLSSGANGKNLFLVPLIDTDTVQQAKQKIIHCVFKRANMNMFSIGCLPSVNDIDLELCLVLIQPTNECTISQTNGQTATTTTLITLKDTEDELVAVTNNSSALNNDKDTLKRLLTIKEYNIQTGSFINLNIKQMVKNEIINQDMKDNHVYMSTMSMNMNEYVLYGGVGCTKPNSTDNNNNNNNNNNNRYHLIKPNISQYSETNTTSSLAQNTNKKKKKKKYEKLLSTSVKCKDSSSLSITTDLLLIKQNENPLNRLSRLLINKATLQPFIDQFVESIFSNSASLPPVIVNLFSFIDSQVKKNGRTLKSDEQERIAKMCKTNLYFVRYWLNVIKNPQLILDLMDDSEQLSDNIIVDSSLSCIAQAFLDSCSATDVHNLYDTDSPVNRLLFIREVPKYKQMMDEFFDDLKSLPQTSEHEMHFYLSEFSKCKNFEMQSQTLAATVNNNNAPSTTQTNRQHVHTELNSVQVLLQLYEYYEKYQHQINTALGQQQCSVLLPVHHRLVQIRELMSMSTMNVTSQTLNRNNIFTTNNNNNNNNPYQQISNAFNYHQPVNCYAATSDLIVTYPNMNTTVQPSVINTLPHLRNQFQPIQQQQFF